MAGSSPTPAQQYIANQSSGGSANPNPLDPNNALISGAGSTTVPNLGTVGEIGQTGANTGIDLFPAGYQPPLHAPQPGAGEGFGVLAPGVQVNALGQPANPSPYVNGNEWGPVNLPAAEIRQLQQALVQAGLLDPATMHPGVWDAYSANAYKTVLAQANAYGATANEMLDALTANPAAKSKGMRLPKPLTNPLDIEAAVNSNEVGSTNTAQRMTGANLPTGETQDFIKWYQHQEALARNAYNNLDLTTQAGYVEAPTLDAAAQAYIKAHNLDQVIAYGTAARQLEFQNMLAQV